MSGSGRVQVEAQGPQGERSGVPLHHCAGLTVDQVESLAGARQSAGATGDRSPSQLSWNLAGIAIVPAPNPPTLVAQRKLIIGASDAPLEREADAVADRVMRMSVLPAAPSVTAQTAGSPNTVQRQCPACAAKDEDEQRLQRSAACPASSTVSAPPIVHDVLRGNGLPLAPAARQFMEPRFGHDFSRVRIYNDASAAESARRINARAYTVGDNIVFGQGQYAPGSVEGRRLLAHELAHTLQQAGSGQALLQRAETDDSRNQCEGLTDVASRVNELVNARLEAARKAAPAGYEKDGDKRGSFLQDAEKRLKDMEQKVHWLPEAHRFTFLGRATLDGTKYEGAEGLSNKPNELSAIVNVGGVCVGADKFGHFFEDGFDAFKATDRKTALLQSGDAEITFQGLGNTGVFSNADIAANLAGRDFYQALDKNPQMQFKVENYFTHRMNEGVNQSYYTRDLGKVVWKNLLESNWSGTVVFTDYEKELSVTFKNVDMAAYTFEGDYLEQAMPDGSDPWNQTLVMTGKLGGELKLWTTEVQGASKKADAVYGVSMTANLDMNGGPDRTGWFRSEGEKHLTGEWAEDDSSDSAEKGVWDLRSS